MSRDISQTVPAIKGGFRAGVRKVVPYAAQYLTSTQRRDKKREEFERKRIKAGEPHTVMYFHDVTDPYSYLMSQKISALMRTYEIELRPMLVSPPTDEAAPERGMLMAYALKDAGDIAPHYNLDFRTGHSMPEPEAFIEAGRLLSAAISRSTFDKDAPRIGAALWANDWRMMEEIKAELPMADLKSYDKHMKLGDRERERQGHYLGAVLAYGGECYWGLDRLSHLEERLLSLELRNSFAAPRLLSPRKSERRESAMIKAHGVDLEFFISLRSPYTYIAMKRVFVLAERYEVNLILRPVLPMVMRGLDVPAAKRKYITFDTKREAEAEGIRFGKVCDPVGEPVERGFSLYPYAEREGRAREYLLSFAEGAFADGLDAGTDSGLKKIVERAGLNWEEAEAQLGNEAWRPVLEANRQRMLELGLWGVPSFCVSGPHAREGEKDAFGDDIEFEAFDDFMTWGQDRLWLVEEEIRKRR